MWERQVPVAIEVSRKRNFRKITVAAGDGQQQEHYKRLFSLCMCVCKCVLTICFLFDSATHSNGRSICEAFAFVSSENSIKQKSLNCKATARSEQIASEWVSKSDKRARWKERGLKWERTMWESVCVIFCYTKTEICCTNTRTVAVRM